VGKPERKRNHFEGPGVDGMIILRLIIRKWNVGMEWIYLAQSRAGGRNFKRGNGTSSSIKWGEFFCLAEELLASQERLHVFSKQARIFTQFICNRALETSQLYCYVCNITWVKLPWEVELI